MANVFQTLRYAALFFLLGLGAGYPSNSIAQLINAQEGTQSLPRSQKHASGPQGAPFSANGPMAYQSSKRTPTNSPVPKKREGIRKAVSAMGYVFLLLASLFFSALGGGALSKTGGSYDKKKGVKYVIIAFSLTVLWMFWGDIVAAIVLL